MTISRRSGSNWVLPSNIRRRSGNSWVDVETIRRRSGSSWITVYTRYTAPTATATGASGEMQMGPPGNPFADVTTFVPAVCTASGGTGSFSYLWERVSGDTAITIVGPGTSSSAYFQTLALPRNTYRTATWRCRVTDGVTTVFSNNVTIRLDYWIMQ